MTLRLDCPSCQSQFKVAADQINLHQGMVRCGHCFTVFNAQDLTLASTNKASSEPLIARPTNSKLLCSVQLLCVLFLLLSAAAQTVYFLRAEISWRYPSSLPYLTQACEKLDCDIALARQINLLVLDDTDLLEDEIRLGLIHLSSTIINQAPFRQAYPNLELTLTDLDDRAKFKRMFRPNDYLANKNDALTGLAAGDSLKLELPLANPDDGIAGYRVRLSY